MTVVFQSYPVIPKAVAFLLGSNTVILFSVLALWHFDSKILKNPCNLSHHSRVMQFLENKIGRNIRYSLPCIFVSLSLPVKLVSLPDAWWIPIQKQNEDSFTVVTEKCINIDCARINDEKNTWRMCTIVSLPWNFIILFAPACYSVAIKPY